MSYADSRSEHALEHTSGTTDLVAEAQHDDLLLPHYGPDTGLVGGEPEPGDVEQVQYLPREGPEPVEEMATLIHSVEGGTLPYGRYRMFVRNLVFYMERPHVDVSSIEQVATFLSASEHVLCVLEESDLVSAGVPAFEIGRVSYLNTGSLTLDTLIWPDPETDLQTVLLVSNRPSILEN